jgi:hypothetical protein
MGIPFYILLPEALAFIPHSNSERRPNAWLREAVIEAAYAVSDRLDAVEQLRASALEIDALVSDLEWSWRRLDLTPPVHADDQDLADQVRATQDDAARDLQKCIRLIGQARIHLAAMLGIADCELRRLHSRATAAVQSIFGRKHDPDLKLDDAHAIALLPVACDAVQQPIGELLGPVLSAAFAERIVRPGIVPEPRKEDQITGSEIKNLARKGTPIKLTLEEKDFALIESIRTRLGFRKNQFAIRAIISKLRNQDPRTELVYHGLYQVVVSVEAVLHTALAHNVVARHGQMLGSRDPKFFDGIIQDAKLIRREGKLLLQLTAGAATPHCPAFLRAITRLTSRAQTIKDAGANGIAPCKGEVEAIFDFLTSLQILS